MLLHYEGFENYPSSTEFYTYREHLYPLELINYTNYYASLEFPTGRIGSGYACNLSANYGGNTTYGYFRLNASLNINAVSEMVIGFAGYWNDSYAQSSDRRIWGFYDTSGNSQFEVRLNDSLYLQIVNSVSGSVIATSPTYLPWYTWHYIEIKFKCHNSQGYFEIYWNGELFMSNYNLNTNPRATNGVIGNQLLFCPYRNYRIDDLYILDLTGQAPFNDRLGPICIRMVVPTADGTKSEWTVRSGGTSHYLEIKDTTIDTDSTYIQSATDGAVDWYKFAAQSGTGLLAVLIYCSYKMQAPGLARLAYGVTNYAESATVWSSYTGFLRQNWDGSSKVLFTAPDGGAWDFTKLNDTQFGIKLKLGLS